MTANTLIHDLLRELPRSVEIFVPELILSATDRAVCCCRASLGCDKKIPPCWTAIIGSLLAFMAIFAQFMYLKTGPDARTQLVRSLFEILQLSADGVGTIGPYFSGLLMHDHFGTLFRSGLLLFLVLVITLTVLTGIPDSEDGPDFYALMCGSTVGMLLAVTTNNLLMLFVAVEMMSVPSYVMVGFLKGRKLSSEAALKYVVYGAGTAGVMLYGISLIAGLLGSGTIPEMGDRFAFLMGKQTFSLASGETITLVLGIIMVLVGLAFKLSLVPFHFWAPDAFEGASAEVGGFLSVGSKAAAFASDGAVRAGLRWRSAGAAGPVDVPRNWTGRDGGDQHDLREPGSLHADEHEAAAGLLDHRSCRLHAAGGVRIAGHAECPRRFKRQPVRGSRALR